MATTTCVSEGGLSRAGLLGEIQTRLTLTDNNVEQMRRRFRALPANHPERIALLRRLEVAAAVAGELESLLGLGGARSQQTEKR
jgi:hypothetical protein